MTPKSTLSHREEDTMNGITARTYTAPDGTIVEHYPAEIVRLPEVSDFSNPIDILREGEAARRAAGKIACNIAHQKAFQRWSNCHFAGGKVVYIVDKPASLVTVEVSRRLFRFLGPKRVRRMRMGVGNERVVLRLRDTVDDICLLDDGSLVMLTSTLRYDESGEEVGSAYISSDIDSMRNPSYWVYAERLDEICAPK